MGNEPQVGDIYRKGVNDTLVLLTKKAADEMGVTVNGLDNDHVLAYTVFYSNRDPIHNTGTIELLNGELKDKDMRRYEAVFADNRAKLLKNYLQQVVRNNPAPHKLYGSKLMRTEENIEANIMPLINDTYKKMA